MTMYCENKSINSPPDASLYRELLALGAGHIGLRNYEEAAAVLSRAVEIDPSPADAYIFRAIAYYNTKQYKLAALDNTAALNIFDGNSHVYLRRALCHEAMGDDMAALADLSRAIGLDPGYALAYSHRANILSRMREHVAASVDLTCAINLTGNDAALFLKRGHIYADMEDYDRAVSDFTSAIALRPESGEAYYARGRIFYRFERISEAVADLSRAHDLSPSLREAAELLSRINNSLREDKLAADPFYIYYYDAFESFLLGDYNAATEESNKLINESSDSAPAYFIKAMCFRRIGNDLVSKAYFKLCADYAERHEREAFFLGISLYYLGHVENSRICLERILRTPSETKFGHYMTACASFILKQYGDTVTSATAALEIQPSMCEVLLLRARAFVQLFDIDAASADYERVRAFRPELSSDNKKDLI